MMGRRETSGCCVEEEDEALLLGVVMPVAELGRGEAVELLAPALAVVAGAFGALLPASAAAA
jgi:hypothetical protein